MLFVVCYFGLFVGLGILLAGMPQDAWSVLAPVLVAALAVSLALYAGLPGEMRGGPGWIAVRRLRGWHIVTADNLVEVRATAHPSYGFLIEFRSRTGQHVDFSPPALRTASVEPALALLDQAPAQSVIVSPIALELLGAAGHRAGSASVTDTRLDVLLRTERRLRALKILGFAAFSLPVMVLALVALVRLAGSR